MERITLSNESATELVALKSVVVVYSIYCFSFPSLIARAARESPAKEDHVSAVGLQSTKVSSNQTSGGFLKP